MQSVRVSGKARNLLVIFLHQPLFTFKSINLQITVHNQKPQANIKFAESIRQLKSNKFTRGIKDDDSVTNTKTC